MNVAERVGRSVRATMVARCLGAFRLADGEGNELQFRTRKAKAILAVLALHGRPMSRDALADLLWSDRGEAQARASLRQTIFELQHLESRGEPLLAVSRDEVSAGRDALATDLELIRTASASGDWARLMTLLESSDSGVLTDLDGLDPELDDWLRLQRAHEPGKTIAAAVEASERCAAEAGPRAALDLVGQILRLDPLNEEATRLAMRFAHETGDRVALHRHFTALRDGLREEYDAEPSTETLELLEGLGNGRAPARSAGSAVAVAAPDATPAPRSFPHSWLLVAGAVAAMLVLAALFLWREEHGAEPGERGVVVAVLPFEQQPQDGSFLAAGLWEETRGALTRNASIRVLGRATTDAMVAQKLPPDQYLKRFGVTHILEGSVRRSGSALLVSVSLTRTSDGVAVWEDSFRGRMGEPFALQDAIASGIEGKLRARLAPGGGRRADEIATSPEVYALYSEARELVSNRDQTDTRRAESLLRKAVRADPNYAPAWSLLGLAIVLNQRVAIADARARAEGMAAVERALSLAPNFAPAHGNLALIEGANSKDAEAPLRRAVALDPSYSEAWNWLGNSLVSQGRFREAIAAYERAIAIDPLLYPAVMNLFMAADELQDRAVLDRLFAAVRRAGPSPELITSLETEQAYQHGDFSAALKMLTERGLDGNGKPRRLLWGHWLENLTAIGYYDALHRITGCPEWYAPLVSGKALPPMSFEGKPVTPEEFWTSEFFSAAASRAMVELGHERGLVQLYRSAYRDADDFISSTDRRDMLPELAANVGVALEATGSGNEAAYLLAATASRLEEELKRNNSRSALGRLAMVRAAQGQRAEALTALDSAIGKGWFPDGRAAALDLAQEPAFQGLRGEPRFEAMRKRLLDHVSRERAELGPLKA
jgi:DNA-binding SARP family transcriptional activator/TolB-like protein/cytochrome c-type biogenesis protein CcmH/NrfG